jgi:uncharacterized protein YdhG (YjbR/CyaY superfamily)
MPPQPTDTAAYIAALPEPQRATLEQLRTTIRVAAPDAQESFSYGMPGFTFGGRPLVWFAAWTHHYSVYPFSAAQLAEVAEPGETYETSKGTIRFPASDALPYDLVTRLVQARVASLRAGGR